ncbi:hypothetical protein HJ588_02750 [Flexivirga sp. ID2601S]|uniref:LppX_LprAFG lipoprotein n=1 Tax=Flexivirga aerilata TaxID=1656889 RepID=A0A849AN11_9MICO|nr:hypothetical protein [Flexivirga aerilata]NNG38192.1 hypothetical protein [Flexivirga aerilata]
MRPVIRLTAAAGGLLLAGSLAACGSSPTVSVTSVSAGATRPSSAASSEAASSQATAAPTAKTVVHQARSSAATATSAHLHAVIAVETGDETVDLKGTMDGSNQELTITYPREGTATVRTVDGKYYIKGDRTFWRTAAAADATSAARIAGKWVQTPAETARRLNGLTLRSFIDELIGPQTISESDLEQATTTRSSGGSTPAWLVDSGQGDTLKVSADSAHHLLEAAGPTDGGRGTATIDGWDSQPRITAPAGAITLPGVGGGGGGGSGKGGSDTSTEDGRTT